MSKDDGKEDHSIIRDLIDELRETRNKKRSWGTLDGFHRIETSRSVFEIKLWLKKTLISRLIDQLDCCWLCISMRISGRREIPSNIYFYPIIKMRLWSEDQELSLDSYSTRDLELPHISVKIIASFNYCPFASTLILLRDCAYPNISFILRTGETRRNSRERKSFHSS